MSSDSGEILVEVERNVAVLTLNAPARRNGLTPAMADELIVALDDIDSRPDVGAVVVRAVGKSFCAGGDTQTLTSAAADPSEPETYDAMSRIYNCFWRFGQLKPPTIAAVRGSAVGAGVNMLLAADLRIIAYDARILCGFLKRGLHPGGGHFVLLSRLVGREAAAAMALFGEEIDGHKAVELGMAWESVDDSSVEDRALQLAAQIASDPPLAQIAAQNFRKETGPPQVDWGLATQFERSSQMWSMRRNYRPDNY